MRVSLVAAALLWLSACQEQEQVMIDGSSKPAFEKSVKKARRTIPDADRLVFDRAIRTVGGRRHAERDPDRLARITFDGMTAAEVVADQRARDR